MRIWIIYIGGFLFGLTGFILLISSTHNPENAILGEWKENKWEYEKVDKPTQDSIEFKDVLVEQNLIIHKAETWTFLPKGRLRLTGEKLDKTVSWRIKGRGHILELRYDNNITEHYNLTELGDTKMVLNFELDMQVRGIARLTFEKLQ